MKILFMRHAQSKDDARRLSQRHNSPLSREGRKQASACREHLKGEPFTAVYTSHCQRTIETASLAFPRHSAQILPFIQEIKRPDVLDGRLHKDAVHFWEVKHKLDKYSADWSIGGSESFNDTLGRIQRLLRYIYENHEEESTIAIVTHGGFIRHFIGYASLKDHYNPHVFFDLVFLLKIKNTSIVEVELNNQQLINWRML